MKIRELHLTAFGPFTARTLVFDGDSGGLQLVYGPNEAGKSSALRGLKALLYGIDERTPDNFLHANDKLRIGGRLQNADGLAIELARRKGRKHTLLDPAGDTLDEQALTPYLRGVTAELFGTLFGIDHQALLRGGQEILEQKGEVGQALFSAALGSHVLHAVLGQLDEEADALFRPRGSKHTINAALKSYADINKAIREQSLSSRVWVEHRRALEHTTAELQKLQTELASERQRVNRLKRIQRMLPKFARLRELMRERALLGDVVVLADDFATRRRQALGELATAQAMLAKAQPRLEGFRRQNEALSINQALLDQAENIEDLHTRLGSHRKALQDRPHLEAERRQFLTDAAFLLKEVRPDLELSDINQLRPVLARRQRIAELGNQYAVLVSRVEQAEASRRDTERRLTAARKQRLKLDDAAFPAAGSSGALRRTIAEARKLGDIDGAIQSDHRELAAMETQCAAGLARLTLRGAVLEDLPGLATPGREGIARFEQDFAETTQRLQRLRERQQQVTDERYDASRGLDELQRVGRVPTEAELTEIRAGRDQLWQLLRRHWQDGEDVSAEAALLAPDTALADAFEQRMAASDELSDRLRREAERVHKMATLEAAQQATDRQIADIVEQIGTCRANQSRLDTDWQALWAACQIQPQSPPEMRAWLDELDKLRDRVGQLSLLRQQSAERAHSRSTHIQQLNQQLQAQGQPGAASQKLEAVLVECEDLAQQMDERQQQRLALDKDINALVTTLASSTDDLNRANQALADWTTQWRGLARDCGLPGDVAPTEAADFIEKLREMFGKQKDAENLLTRIEAIDKDAASFREQVAGMVARIAAELAALPADDAVIRLNSLLSENRSNLKRRQQIDQQIEQTQQEIQDAKATIGTMTTRLSALSVEAGCAGDPHFETESAKRGGNDAALEEAERRSARYVQISAEAASIERDILENGEGASVAELEQETEGVDADALPGCIGELSHRIDDELEPRRTELAQTRGREQKELELMDGGDQAAVLADQAQATLADIRSGAERYVRVKLAGRILRDRIEHYRNENQGPLILRAAEHFATLTIGSFATLVTDFNDRDEPVLAGVRPDGQRVHVQGMSAGTRDQLYLALRLASLEKYMETAEPMPFIVDDVLVDFDDRRTEAALRALAELAGKTQVILFTHHSRLLEQARRLHAAIHEL